MLQEDLTDDLENSQRKDLGRRSSHIIGHIFNNSANSFSAGISPVLSMIQFIFAATKFLASGRLPLGGTFKMTSSLETTRKDILLDL